MLSPGKQILAVVSLGADLPCVSHAVGHEVNAKAIDSFHPTSAVNKMMTEEERLNYVNGFKKVVDVLDLDDKKKEVILVAIISRCIHNRLKMPKI